MNPNARTIAPLTVSASGDDFGYVLNLAADHPLVLQGDGGYSKKSERGQASYYYSQPYFTASGAITVGDRQIAVTGRAWMDREWSSQPLASDQTGWDWFSLHLSSGEKVMPSACGKRMAGTISPATGLTLADDLNLCPPTQLR